MKAKRRRHSSEFKAKVGMEALKGVKTIQQLAKEFEVHPVQVSDWKKVIVENLAGVFERIGIRFLPPARFLQPGCRSVNVLQSSRLFLGTVKDAPTGHIPQ